MKVGHHDQVQIGQRHPLVADAARGAEARIDQDHLAPDPQQR